MERTRKNLDLELYKFEVAITCFTVTCCIYGIRIYGASSLVLCIIAAVISLVGTAFAFKLADANKLRLLRTLRFNSWILYIYSLGLTDMYWDNMSMCILSGVVAIIISSITAITTLKVSRETKKRLIFSLIAVTASMYRVVIEFKMLHQIVVSLIIMAFAIGLLLLGFKVKRKEMRTYSLLLIVICVGKMIFADISGTNTFIRAGAFVIAGIFCLGISTLYFKYEKEGLR